MRMILFSDSHGSVQPMFDAIAEESPDCILHLGDCTPDCDEVRLLYPTLEIRQVRGNCDRFSAEPQQRLFSCFGKRIMMTHGHLYHVKYGVEALLAEARERQADLALFGHTHCACCEEHGPLLLINPGSLGYGGHYGVLELTADSVHYLQR